MKTVNYFGTSYTVPDYAKFIATDEDGQMWWHAIKPMSVGATWGIKGGNCDGVGNNHNVKNWRRSLREC